MELETSTETRAACNQQHVCGGHEKNHTHGESCGHKRVQHEDHFDYVVGDHTHCVHGDHCHNGEKTSH